MVMDPESEYLSYGLAAGADGVLPKQYVAGQMVRAISAVRQGKIYLPPRVPGGDPEWPRRRVRGLTRPLEQPIRMEIYPHHSRNLGTCPLRIAPKPSAPVLPFVKNSDGKTWKPVAIILLHSINVFEFFTK